MAEPTRRTPPQTRGITLDADGLRLSALLALPQQLPPRAVVVAVHGGGMRAGYFDSRARPGHSLLTLGAELGYAVLAVDRPGYGASAAQLPQGQSLADQSATLRAALTDFARNQERGAGYFVVAHSNGGKLALALAAGHEPGTDLVGLDISGLGTHLAVEPHDLPGPDRPGTWRRHWGPLRLYPPEAFGQCRDVVAPVPALEAQEAARWPQIYQDIAARVRVPVRFTFAEQEQWWHQDEQALRALRAPLAAPHVVIDRQPDAGHNISLGWASRTYHLQALAFLEKCLLARETAAVTAPR
nr:thioesterase [Streptomyces sp.]